MADFGGAAQREYVGRNEHHVRGGSHQQSTVKFSWREMRFHVREQDAAERIARKVQRIPVGEITRAEDGVNAGRSADGKSKCAKALLLREGELDREWIGEHLHALILQVGDGRGQIRGSQWFGQDKSRERIAAEKYRAQVRHVWRQR